MLFVSVGVVMVKPSSSQSSKAVQELAASVRSNVEVIRDALKAPATEDSHAVVSDLMLEVKQSQEKLQKKAAELAETGEFDNTNEIFEAIDQVTQLEPEFDNWSKSVAHQDVAPDQIGSTIHVEEPEEPARMKKKKKKKRKESMPPESSGGWEAFPPPSGTSWPSQAAPVVEQQPMQSVGFPEPPQAIQQTQSVRFAEPGNEQVPANPGPSGPAKGRITLGMTWA